MSRTTDTPATTRDAKPRYRALALILLTALGLRGYLMVTATLVSRDTVTFVRYAQGLSERPLEAMRANDQHPLYPLLILGMHNVRSVFGAKDTPQAWAISAQIISCFGGLVCVVAMYVLTRRLFNDRVAVLAALFMAWLPEACQNSADGLSDMPHLAIYLLAVCAAVRGVEQAELTFLGLAGFLSGVAFLTRPEGLAVAAVTAVVLLRFPKSWAMKKRLPVAALVAVAFLVPACPYGMITGKVVQKKSIKTLIGIEEAARAPAVPSAPLHADSAVKPRAHLAVGLARRAPRPATSRNQSPEARASLLPLADLGQPMPPLWAVVKLFEKWVRSLRVTYFVFFVMGLFLPLASKPSTGSVAVLAGVAAVHVLAVLAVATSYGYISLRHMIVPASLCLPHAAAAADYAITYLAANVPMFDRPWRARGAVLAVIILPTLPWVLERLNPDKLHYVRAAEYIRDQYPQNTTVSTMRFRIAFFAGRPFPNLGDSGDVDALLAHPDGADKRLVVVDANHSRSKNPRFFEELKAAGLDTGRLKLVKEISATPPAEPNRILIYEIAK